MVSNLSLILVLMSTSIKCQDVCQLIKPNGTYRGLGVYRYYTQTGSELRMFSKAGADWEIIIDSNGEIQYKSGSMKTGYNQDVVFKFGVQNMTKESRNCVVKTAKTNSFETKCFDQGDKLQSQDSTTTFNNSVIMRPFSRNEEMYLSHVLVLNRTNKKPLFHFNPFPLKEGNKLAHSCISSKSCPFPTFVHQMNVELFSQIESTVDLQVQNDRKSGCLLLFKIDGRPKYCINREDTFIECKSLDDVITLWNHCFTDSTPQTDSGSIDPLVWVIIVEAVIGGILSIAVFVMIVIRRKEMTRRLLRNSSQQTVLSSKVSQRSKRIKGLSQL